MRVKRTLLDTNVLSELLRPDAEPRVVAFLEEQNDPLVSAIVFHELSYGVALLPEGRRKDGLRMGIDAFRRTFRKSTIVVDDEIAGISGRLRAAQRRSGFPLKELDSMIAGCAIAASARLANSKHPGLRTPRDRPGEPLGAMTPSPVFQTGCSPNPPRTGDAPEL